MLFVFTESLLGLLDVELVVDVVVFGLFHNIGVEHHFLFCLLCIAFLSTGSQPLLLYFLPHPLLVAT